MSNHPTQPVDTDRSPSTRTMLLIFAVRTQTSPINPIVWECSSCTALANSAKVRRSCDGEMRY